MLIWSFIFFSHWFETKEVEELVSKSCKKLLNLRPAEKFFRCSQLLTEGCPSVYLLAGIERASPNPELRWLDFGKPSTSEGEKFHKVLMLMGPMDSGKSTLINGMVNHILGVQWNDPFRFRIAKEDNSTGLITIYTIHHAKGMTIDYGITIVDIPSFGGTDDQLERDQEITRLFGRFLSHPQAQSYLNSIHAVCFVETASTNLRLERKNIIESDVVSLFGRDVRNSLKLLVTIAGDGMKPLEPIKTRHQKFHNSALYASNSKADDNNNDGDLSDKNCWNLGRSNFEDFFSMLAEMPVQSLKQTSSVIQARINLDRSLQELDQLLKKSWETMDNVHLFKQQIAQLRTVVEDYLRSSCKPRKTVPCDSRKKAFNCTRCKTSCGVHWINWLEKNRHVVHCLNVHCTCLREYHKLQSFRWVERPVQVTNTMQVKKEEYELSLARKSTIEELLKFKEEELEEAKRKGVALLKNVADCLKYLKSSALWCDESSVADFVSIIKTRNQKEKQIGWATRDELLDELLASSLENSRPGRSHSIAGHSSNSN